MDKQWRIVPRGIAVTIGCSTFPTWNSYPGMFASLATGNTVIVKPHPAAILPLALTVRICRDVLKEAGFDPNVVLLAVDEAVCADHQGAGHASRRRHRRLHRLARVRPLGARERQGCAGLHRGGGRQLDRDRLDAELQRHVRQHRLLAGAVLGPDVHCAAGHLRAARRHRHATRAARASTRSRAASPARSRS